MMGTTYKTTVPARDAENISSLQYASGRYNRMDKTAQYEAHSTYKYSWWTTYYKEEMGGARNIHGRDDKITKHVSQKNCRTRTTLDTNVNWNQQTVMLSAFVRKFLLKLQHVSSGLDYHQEEILEHTEATTVQMLKHNSISSITRWVFGIPLT